MSNYQIDNEALKIKGIFTTSACPVQAEGFVDRLPFYFRARWDEWRMTIVLVPGDDPVDPKHESFTREGVFGDGEFDASWMPLEEARRLIDACANEFLHAQDELNEERQR